MVSKRARGARLATGLVGLGNVARVAKACPRRGKMVEAKDRDETWVLQRLHNEYGLTALRRRRRRLLARLARLAALRGSIKVLPSGARKTHWLARSARRRAVGARLAVLAASAIGKGRDGARLATTRLVGCAGHSAASSWWTSGAGDCSLPTVRAARA